MIGLSIGLVDGGLVRRQAWAQLGGRRRLCIYVQQQQQQQQYPQTFFDRAPASARQHEGSAAAPTNHSRSQPQHVCELAPPTVPAILPTPVFPMPDLLEHSPSHATAQRIPRVEKLDGRQARAHKQPRVCTTRHAAILRAAHEWPSNE